MSDGECGTSWMMAVNVVKMSSHDFIQDLGAHMVAQVLRVLMRHTFTLTSANIAD
jgi:hypothetical protein